MSDSQVPFATLGNAIGFISKLSGSVTIQSIDGQERVVKIGDPIFFGETVVTGANSSVTIAFIDGTEVVIGGDSVVEITDEIYNSGDNQDLVADSSTDIDALQNAILAGDDPTLVQDAPAAGETQGEQQRVDVDVQRTGALGGISGGNDTDYSSSLPGFGYDTNGQGSYGSRQENVTTTQQNTTRNTSTGSTTSDEGISAVTDSDADANTISESAANGTEVQITGLATDEDAGDTVTYSLSDDYNGAFTIDATTGVVTVADNTQLDYESDTAPTIEITATSSDTTSSKQTFTINLTDDTKESGISAVVDSDADANIISESAANGAVVEITGLATDADATDTVTYSLSKDYNGAFTIDATTGVVTVADNTKLDYETDTAPTIEITATSSDTTSSKQTFTINLTDGAIGTVVINFESTGGDDVYNAEEVAAGEAGTITATISVAGSEVGDTLTYSVNGGESVTVILDAEDIANGVAIEVAPGAQVTATLSDAAGNVSDEASATALESDIDVKAPTISIAGDTNEDGIYNKAELGEDGTVTATISLPDDFDAAKDTLTINGETHTLTAAEIEADEVNVEIDPEETITAQITDAAGNVSDEASATALESDVAAIAGTVTVANITADDVINATESGETIAVTGTATGGDIAEGDVVTMTINGEDYSTTVDADGNWTVNVAGADLAADTEFEVVVTSSDAAGNTVESKATSTHTVDTEIGTPTISLGAGSDSGESDSDNLTNNKAPSFSFGNVDSDVTSVEVFNGTTKLGDAAKVSGVWLFTAAEGQLIEGVNNLILNSDNKCDTANQV